MFRLPDVSAEQLACIIASLRLTAKKSGEPGFLSLANWLQNQAYNITLPPDVAATVKWSLDTKREGPLRFYRDQAKAG